MPNDTPYDCIRKGCPARQPFQMLIYASVYKYDFSVRIALCNILSDLIALEC